MNALLVRLESSWRQSPAGRWFYGREPGERKIIAVLALLLVLALLWLLVWKPIDDFRSVAHNRYENARSNLELVQANEEQLRSKVNSGGAGSERTTLRIITQAAKASGLKLNRVQPEGAGGVSVVLQDQPFNDVLGFVAQLAENNGVQVGRAAIDDSGTSGRVNAQIKFE